MRNHLIKIKNSYKTDISEQIHKLPIHSSPSLKNIKKLTHIIMNPLCIKVKGFVLNYGYVLP